MSPKSTNPEKAELENQPIRPAKQTEQVTKQPAGQSDQAINMPPKPPKPDTGQATGSSERRIQQPAQKKILPARQYERFHWAQRIAHALLLISFTLLGITGLAQKYALTGWAQVLISLFGGIDTIRRVHHFFAIMLMLLAIYHILDIGYKIFVRRVSLTMLPSLKDIKDALQAFLYNLGFKKTRPQMGRYTFEEKAEYWALIWGTMIMGLTGFLMWNPITSTRLFPGEVIPAAKAAHGGEALLAVLAIVVWHMYGVHIRRFNKSMWTGRQSETEMLHEHPLELADIKAGIASRMVDAKTLYRRRLVYIPVASILAVVMLLGVYGFVSGEKTAITTVLPIASPVAIYVPQTPTPIPTAQPSPTSAGVSSGALTWDATIGVLFQEKCSMCHGAALASKGLSFGTYADALKGAEDGPVIIPGNVDGSKLIVVQSSGKHPGLFSAEALAIIKNWIAAGAIEK